MQKGVLVCVLLLACHSRQGDSSASTTESERVTNVPKERSKAASGAPALHKNSLSNTTLDSTHQTLFTSSYSTTQTSTRSPSSPNPTPTSSPNPNPTNVLPKIRIDTGSTRLPPALSTPPQFSTYPLEEIKTPSNLPFTTLPSSQTITSTLSPTNFSLLTFSTFNASRLESTTSSAIEVTAALTFDKSLPSHSSLSEPKNRTLKETWRQVNKNLKFINRVKSVSASFNASKSSSSSHASLIGDESSGARNKTEGIVTLDSYKSLVHPTKIGLTDPHTDSNTTPSSEPSTTLSQHVDSSSPEITKHLLHPPELGATNTPQNLRVISESAVGKVHGKKHHPLQVSQVDNLRLSLGDTSEIRVGSDVIRNRVSSSHVGSDAEFRHQSDVNTGRVHDTRDVIKDRGTGGRFTIGVSKAGTVAESAGNVAWSQNGVSRVGSDVMKSSLSQSTARNSEVMSPPPSHVDVSKHTSPITDVNDGARKQNRTEKSWTSPGGGIVSETAHGTRDDYYEYAEYSDFPMKHFNISGFREAAVIPDPDLRDDEAVDTMVESGARAAAAAAAGAGVGVGAAPEIILPDDSLADTDLHDHDLIDSVMYIYFGGSREDGRGAGRQVLIVGAVIGLVAQFLSLASAVQRVRSYPREETTVILLHTQLAFTVSNLVFMLGVQATSIAGQCARVALSLHYLHMTAGVWLLINCANVCLRICVKLRHAIAAWGLPLFYVLGCYILNRRIYETRNFCWMSIHRGLLLSFVTPAFIFLTVNTTLGAIGYTRSRFQCQQSATVDRKALRVAVVLLPAFIFDWFVEIVALEKSSALVFPLLFVGSKAFINWFIFACWLPSDQSWQDIEDEYDEDFDDLEDDMPPSLVKLKYMVDAQADAHAHKSTDEYKLPYYHYPSDDLPLLHESMETYKCGRRDVCDLQMDPISTICS